jgi:methionyl-tRNA formyltransferase
MRAGTLVATPQDERLATYAPLLEKQHGIIDWTRSAPSVANRIRGVDPWPGATTTWRGEPLKLFAPRAIEGHGRAGEVLAVDERGLVVACGGGGACALSEVQPAGKRRMGVREFAAGRRLRPGEVLGETP